MPYVNIHWVKLKLELLNDKRFLFDLDDDQKLLFIGLLGLAGATKNEVPDDENFIKNRLNLRISAEKVRENIERVVGVFPKTMRKNGFISFKNFNKMHNKIGNYFGTPLDIQSGSNGNKEKSRVDKRRIDTVRRAYTATVGLDESTFVSADYGRLNSAAKKLIVRAEGKDDLVIEGLKWISKKNFSWTMETLLRLWPEFLKERGKKFEVPNL